MARSRLWKLAAGLLVAASGCAHCDTCDDPPVPCMGPGCSAALNVAPASNSMVGPFSSPASSDTTASKPGGTMPTFTAPDLPDVPADAPSPPAPPVAPEKP